VLTSTHEIPTAGGCSALTSALHAVALGLLDEPLNLWFLTCAPALSR
jgi:hypothetical protein